MSAPFSYHLGLAALLTTVGLCGCTMLYLVIEKQQMIKQMQKSLYSIYLKSIAGQVPDSNNSNDSGVDSNNLSLKGDRLFLMVEESHLYTFWSFLSFWYDYS